MFAKNAHLTDEKEIKAKLDLAEFVKKGGKCRLPWMTRCARSG